MSLIGTLGKVAMGIIVAKGVGMMLDGGGSSSGGGLGGLLGGLTGSVKKSNTGGAGGLGDLLNNALQGNDTAASANQDSQAEVMLGAMISAAKSDGELDDEEKRKITEHLGDVSQEEADFVRQELEAPLDTQGLIRTVPRGMEEQVYFMALLAIDLDSNHEAHFPDELAKGLNISHQSCNQIHEKLGAPALYA